MQTQDTRALTDLVEPHLRRICLSKLDSFAASHDFPKPEHIKVLRPDDDARVLPGCVGFIATHDGEEYGIQAKGIDHAIR